MNTRLLSSVLAALLVTTLAGCGSDDDVEAGKDPVANGGPEPVVFTLTTDLGCGYGFARTNDNATQLLQIYYDGSARALTESVELPDPHWDAIINVGKRLDANWCNDVIIDPQADVEETWTIVDGTLLFDDGAPHVDGSRNPEPVRAHLVGAVAQGPDGERVSVGDVPLTNSSFGMFAG